MSFHRSVFVALATVFTVGMAPAAFAQCCGYQAPAPTYYEPVAQGCGTCGVQAYAPVVYATPVAPAPINVGCGTCGTPIAAVTFAPPTPTWGNGCGVCGTPAPVAYNPCNTCGLATTPVYTQPAPAYVVNQGPDYSGAGLMVPYRTYAPQAEYAPPPYYPSYPHRYYPRPYYHHAYYAPRPYGHPYYGRYYTHHYWRG